MPTWIEIEVEQWAKAIKHASAEHGRPNRFNVTELAQLYPLSQRGGYYVGRLRLFELWQALGGREGWGSQPTYSKGWFYV